MFTFRSTPWSEARSAARHRFFQRAAYLVPEEGRPEACDIFDISRTGIRFHCRRPLAPGTRIVVLFRQGEAVHRLPADVVWHTPHIFHRHGARFAPEGDWAVLFARTTGHN